jgi:hypothetical protein
VNVRCAKVHDRTQLPDVRDAIAQEGRICAEEYEATQSKPASAPQHVDEEGRHDVQLHVYGQLMRMAAALKYIVAPKYTCHHL